MISLYISVIFTSQLCQAYCGYVVHALKGLHYIDGEEVTNEARYAYAQTAINWQESNSMLSIKLFYECLIHYRYTHLNEDQPCMCNIVFHVHASMKLIL